MPAALPLGLSLPPRGRRPARPRQAVACLPMRRHRRASSPSSWKLDLGVGAIEVEATAEIGRKCDRATGLNGQQVRLQAMPHSSIAARVQIPAPLGASRSRGSRRFPTLPSAVQATQPRTWSASVRASAGESSSRTKPSMRARACSQVITLTIRRGWPEKLQEDRPASRPRQGRPAPASPARAPRDGSASQAVDCTSQGRPRCGAFRHRSGSLAGELERPRSALPPARRSRAEQARAPAAC